MSMENSTINIYRNIKLQTNKRTSQLPSILNLFGLGFHRFMMETNLLSQVDAIDRFWKLIFVLESMGKKLLDMGEYSGIDFEYILE
ncbi:hypothetical protein BLOT_010498 [Blomia tropicalis]|nr:hypothetical protein BLOT_010498 [Blomia tropicalis]